MKNDDLAACRSYLWKRSPSVFVTSFALPPRIRDAATALYAWSRDLADMVREPDPPPSAVLDIKERVAGVWSGAPKPHPTDRAFARVVADYAIDRVVFEFVVEGLAWEADCRRYATIDALLDYCARVSGAIGVCLVLIMGRRQAAVLERASDLGIAIELTRIARDIGEDARRGRVRIPLEWLEEVGGDADALLDARQATYSTRRVAHRILEAAEGYFLRADPGILALPFDCRPAIRAMRYAYSAIATDIERAEYDSMSARPTLSWPRKLALFTRALRPAPSEGRPLVVHGAREIAPLLRALQG